MLWPYEDLRTRADIKRREAMENVLHPLSTPVLLELQYLHVRKMWLQCNKVANLDLKKPPRNSPSTSSTLGLMRRQPSSECTSSLRSSLGHHLRSSTAAALLANPTTPRRAPSTASSTSTRMVSSILRDLVNEIVNERRII